MNDNVVFRVGDVCDKDMTYIVSCFKPLSCVRAHSELNQDMSAHCFTDC